MTTYSYRGPSSEGLSPTVKVAVTTGGGGHAGRVVGVGGGDAVVGGRVVVGIAVVAVVAVVVGGPVVVVDRWMVGGTVAAVGGTGTVVCAVVLVVVVGSMGSVGVALSSVCPSTVAVVAVRAAWSVPGLHAPAAPITSTPRILIARIAASESNCPLAQRGAVNLPACCLPAEGSLKPSPALSRAPAAVPGGHRRSRGGLLDLTAGSPLFLSSQVLLTKAEERAARGYRWVVFYEGAVEGEVLIQALRRPGVRPGRSPLTGPAHDKKHFPGCATKMQQNSRHLPSHSVRFRQTIIAGHTRFLPSP